MSEKKEYIERGAFIDFIDAGHLRYATEKVFSENDLVKMISERPAADVEPVVRANWEREFREVPVKDGSRCVMKVLYKCAGESGCKEYSIINSKRCPNCGAHMERSGSGE